MLILWDIRNQFDYSLSMSYYAGPKFSETPAPSSLPDPPPHWLTPTSKPVNIRNNNNNYKAHKESRHNSGSSVPTPSTSLNYKFNYKTRKPEVRREVQ